MSTNPEPTLTEPQSNKGPSPLLGCPLLLEPLSPLDRVLVNQIVEDIDVVSGFRRENKYHILDSSDKQIYEANEEVIPSNRKCVPDQINVRVKNMTGQGVMLLERPSRCCGEELSVYSPPECLIGFVMKRGIPCCGHIFAILDESGQEVLQIRIPFCTTGCCGREVRFEIRGKNGSKVGEIRKQWGGLKMEALTDADNFIVTFPRDLDVKTKAIILGACILIDYCFFDQPTNTTSQTK